MTVNDDAVERFLQFWSRYPMLRDPCRVLYDLLQKEGTKATIETIKADISKVMTLFDGVEPQLGLLWDDQALLQKTLETDDKAACQAIADTWRCNPILSWEELRELPNVVQAVDRLEKHQEIYSPQIWKLKMRIDEINEIISKWR